MVLGTVVGRPIPFRSAQKHVGKFESLVLVVVVVEQVLKKCVEEPR